MMIEVRVANADEFEELWRLNHEIYCRELGQHSLDSSGLRVDKLHNQAVYFVAYVNGELAGMLSITPPGVAGISTLTRIPYDEELHGAAANTAEVRLLGVRLNFRGEGVYGKLIYSLMQYCAVHSIHRILISAVERQVRLYALMGFKPIAKPVVENNCVLQPMLLLRADFEASTYRLKTLARMDME